MAIAGGRQRNLLAAMLVHGGDTVSFDGLVEAVWDGRPPSGARGALHTCLARLRAQLGPAGGARIVARAPGYRLITAPGEVDLERFEAAAARGRRSAARGQWAVAYQALTEAVALHRGAPLADVASAALREAWVEPLEQRLLAVQLELVDAGLQAGRQVELLPRLTRLCQEHPLDERLHERLMLALHQDGRTVDALAAYRAARQALVRELGVEPGPVLRRLHDRILGGGPQPAHAQDPPAGAPAVVAARPAPAAARSAQPPQADRPALVGTVVPAQLPSALTDFTGRDVELERLVELLSAPVDGVAVAVISGCGGLGKSALALQAAHRVRDHYPDGQLFAALAGHSGAPRQAGEVLGSFLLALGLDQAAVPVAAGDRAALFRSLVADRRVLVVLDDAREIADVRLLLPGGPGCAVLVSSRDRLPGIAGAALLELDVLPAEQARALLAKSVGRARVEAEPDAVREILEACAGLPLAVRIVGARLAARPSWSMAHLAARLTDESSRLRELRVGDLAVAASFALSYASVREADAAHGSGLARTFRLLGLVTGPTIGLSTAGALLDQPLATVEEALESLVDAHLLEAGHPGRYRFHDLLRAYARDAAHQEESPEVRDEAVHRLLGFFRGATAAAAAQLNPGRKDLAADDEDGSGGSGGGAAERLPFPDRAAAVHWLDGERANLLAACRQAAHLGLDSFTWQLARNMAQYFRLGGHVDEYVDSHLLAVAATRRLGDRAAEFVCLANLAMPYWQSGRYPEAADALTRSHALAVELGDAGGQAACLIRLGVVHAAGGDPERAIESFRAALPVLHELGDLRDEANALANLGYTLGLVGRHDQALEVLDRAVAVSREAGERRSEGHALIGLGQTLGALDRLGEALDRLRQGLAAVRECKDLAGETEALVEMAETLRRLQVPGAALEHANRALELMRSQENRPELRATVHRTLGLIHQEGGDRRQAAEHQRLARELTERLGGPAPAATLDAVVNSASRSGS
ncbi:AfsR/SARP family transcriptional regulator [Kitasatospora viridis]|uniref:AfsR/SARP family transcriptional regulator n=1 Tax=Kitasatospora viridis TaxID=281105 RepID=UPI001478B51F|nr:BTAD domain-containing putative transcriptional regulator [Kitasatospora viridis]